MWTFATERSRNRLVSRKGYSKVLTIPRSFGLVKMIMPGGFLVLIVNAVYLNGIQSLQNYHYLYFNPQFEAQKLILDRIISSLLKPFNWKNRVLPHNFYIYFYQTCIWQIKNKRWKIISSSFQRLWNSWCEILLRKLLTQDCHVVRNSQAGFGHLWAGERLWGQDTSSLENSSLV